jgi:hypothetical protein
MRTRELVRNRPRTITLEKIAQEAHVSVFWLKQFTRTKGITEPSVSKVEAIYNVLSAKPLEV